MVGQEEVHVAVADSKHGPLLCADKICRLISNVLHMAVGQSILTSCSTVSVGFRLSSLVWLLLLLGVEFLLLCLVF